MNVVINGEPRALADGSSVADALALVLDTAARRASDATAHDMPAGSGPAGIAVAVNGAVVTRASWPSVLLGSGDEVEVLTAVQGG